MSDLPGSDWPAIKLNNTGLREPCVLCGESVHTARGPELFTAEGFRAICPGCGWKHAPGIMVALAVARVLCAPTGYALGPELRPDLLEQAFQDAQKRLEQALQEARRVLGGRGS